MLCMRELSARCARPAWKQQRRFIHPPILIASASKLLYNRLSSPHQATVRKWLKRATVFGAVSGTLFLATNVERVPLTNRLRLQVVPKSVINGLCEEEVVNLVGGYREDLFGKMEFVQGTFQGQVLPNHDPRVKRTLEVVTRVCRASRDMVDHEIDWTLYVVDSPLVNAFVMDSGHIFVFRGLLDMLQDDELAMVVGHELTHALCGHGAEQASLKLCQSAAVTVLEIGALLVAPSEILFAWVMEGVRNTGLPILTELPYSRKLESEADEFGMYLAARACYHPEAAPRVWEMFGALQQEEMAEWLSTHPPTATRLADCTENIPKAMEHWNESKCEVRRKQLLSSLQETLTAFLPFNVEALPFRGPPS